MFRNEGATEKLRKPEHALEDYCCLCGVFNC